MKPSYRTPFEGLILRDGQTKGSNPPLRYFWHRWTRSETAPPPVFTSASHPLEIAFLSRAGLPDAAGPVGYCMLPGRRLCINQIVAAPPLLNHGLHAIDARPARRRGGVGLASLDSVINVALSPRNDSSAPDSLIDLRTGEKKLKRR